MSKKKNKPERSIKSLKDVEQGVTSDYIGGDLLDELLSKLIRSVEVAKASRAGLLEKIWMKQQFYVGVNDVTRVLERMPATASSHSVCSSEGSTRTALRRAPLVPLQVPVLCIKGNRGSSLRLGQVANVRTALAIGIKARGSIINETIDEVLKASKPVADEQ
ncbi:unnamed protein product [Alopecurus aequalis]